MKMIGPICSCGTDMLRPTRYSRRTRGTTFVVVPLAIQFVRSFAIGYSNPNVVIKISFSGSSLIISPAERACSLSCADSAERPAAW